MSYAKQHLDEAVGVQVVGVVPPPMQTMASAGAGLVTDCASKGG